MIERVEYDAYGTPTVYNSDFTQSYDVSQQGNPYLFTGRRLDAFDTNDALTIYYYRARHFDPQTGRFMQRDPVNYTDVMNLYVYVQSGPLNATDPFGLISHGLISPYVTPGTGYSYHEPIPLPPSPPDFDIEVFSVGGYLGLGGELTFTIKKESEDCCACGMLIKDGKYKYAGDLTAVAGLGIGGKVKFTKVLDIDATHTIGPYLSETLDISLSNSSCGGTIDEFSVCRVFSGGVTAGLSGSLSVFSTGGSVSGYCDFKLCAEIDDGVLWGRLKGKCDLDWKTTTRIGGIKVEKLSGKRSITDLDPDMPPITDKIITEIPILRLPEPMSCE